MINQQQTIECHLLPQDFDYFLEQTIPGIKEQHQSILKFLSEYAAKGNWCIAIACAEIGVTAEVYIANNHRLLFLQAFKNYLIKHEIYEWVTEVNRLVQLQQSK